MIPREPTAPASSSPLGAGAPARSPAAQPIVSLRGITKSFGGTEVLHGIDLEVRPGTVHGLVGENGAGKSTLSKIIAGLYTADSGELIVNGETVTLRSPREALAHGIATIAQELALVPSLTVAENVFLGEEPQHARFIDRRSLRRKFVELADQAGFELDPDAVTGRLRTADQQKVEILRALSRGASLIIMDEPTAALSRADADKLYGVVRSLAAQGRTVVLISHFLGEVLELSDDVTILRDGRLVRSGPASAETESSLIEGMLGRTLGALFPDKAPAPRDSATVLDVSNLHAPGVNGISLRVRAGEILGIAGLVGSGRSELAHAIFGSTKRESGTVSLDGSRLTRNSPSHSLSRGIYLIPESRKEQGLVLERPVRENVTLPSLRLFNLGSWIAGRRERSETRRALTAVTVRTDAAASAVSSLSGGNQQKVLFARGMLHAPRLLIADEPTRGVDVGSRRAIYELLVEQATSGIGVIVISSDVDEVLGLAHRVVVIHGGRISAELDGAGMTEENVLVAAFAEHTESPADTAAGAPATPLAAPSTTPISPVIPDIPEQEQ